MSYHPTIVIRAHGRDRALLPFALKSLVPTKTKPKVVILSDGHWDLWPIVRPFSKVLEIRFEEQANQGPFVSKINSLRLAETEPVLPLDADDLMIPYALDTLMEYWDGSFDIALTPCWTAVQHYRRNGAGEQPSTRSLWRQRPYLPDGSVLRTYAFNEFALTAYTSWSLRAISLIREVPDVHPRSRDLIEDWYTYMDSVCNGSIVRSVPVPTRVYIRHQRTRQPTSTKQEEFAQLAVPEGMLYIFRRYPSFSRKCAKLRIAGVRRYFLNIKIKNKKRAKRGRPPITPHRAYELHQLVNEEEERISLGSYAPVPATFR